MGAWKREKYFSGLFGVWATADGQWWSTVQTAADVGSKNIPPYSDGHKLCHQQPESWPIRLSGTNLSRSCQTGILSAFPASRKAGHNYIRLFERRHVPRAIPDIAIVEI